MNGERLVQPIQQKEKSGLRRSARQHDAGAEEGADKHFANHIVHDPTGHVP